jgi:hypothetical protein
MRRSRRMQMVDLVGHADLLHGRWRLLALVQRAFDFLERHRLLRQRLDHPRTDSSTNQYAADPRVPRLTDVSFSSP